MKHGATQMNTQAIAQHLNLTEELIVEVQEWAKVLWVRIKGMRPKFVSKKVLKVVMELDKCDLSQFAKLKPAISLKDGDVIFTPDTSPVVRVLEKVDKSRKTFSGHTIVKTGTQIASPMFREDDHVWVFDSKDSANKALEKIIRPMQREIALLKSLSKESLIKLAQELKEARSDEREAVVFDDNPRSFGSEFKEEQLKRLVILAHQKNIEVPQSVLESIS